MKSLLGAALLLLATTATAQLGSIAFPTSGKPEAQPAFLRGVAALHSFWYDEAADAFREAQRIDPDFAMAYWGEAMTYNHPIWMEVDADAGRKVLARLVERKTTTTAREKAYIDAVHLLYGQADKAARDDAYEGAMDRLATAFPDDVEAQAFHALAILGTRPMGDGDLRKPIRAAAILEPLYAAHPDHPGVLHYMIHAYDDPLHAPLGLRAAQRYARVAPAAFHALHMPSHIFLQLGMWPETIASNEHAYATSKQWTEAKKLPRAKRDLHSLSWLQYALLQEEKFDDARKLLDEVAPMEGEEARERTTRATMQARYAIETGDSSVLPQAGDDDPPPLLFARGLAAARRVDHKSASAMLAKLKKHGNPNTDVMAKELEVMLATDLDRALKLAAEAVALEAALGTPSGPPDVIKPAHELYGELLLKNGRTDDASREFQKSLDRTPNRRLSVRGAKEAGMPRMVMLEQAAVQT